MQTKALESSSPYLVDSSARPECFVDQDERNDRERVSPVQSKLISQTGGQDGVSELLLLAAGLSAEVGVVLVPRRRRATFRRRESNNLRTSVTFRVSACQVLVPSLPRNPLDDEPYCRNSPRSTRPRRNR